MTQGRNNQPFITWEMLHPLDHGGGRFGTQKLGEKQTCVNLKFWNKLTGTAVRPWVSYYVLIYCNPQCTSLTPCFLLWDYFKNNQLRKSSAVLLCLKKIVIPANVKSRKMLMYQYKETCHEVKETDVRYVQLAQLL